MKIAILLLSCAKTARRTTLTADWFRLLSKEVAQYFLDQSGGRLTCQFTVYDWMELSITGAKWNAVGPAVGDTARAEAAKKYKFKETDYDRYVLVIDEQVGTLGVTDYKTDTRIAAVDATPTIFTHELGHAFGANHTQLETPEGPEEYGGPFCIMGLERGKYAFFDPKLASPKMGSDRAHSESGPGMCIPSLSQANWLNIDVSCHRLVPFGNGSLGSTVRIPALNGAPSASNTIRIGCLIDIYDRFIVEYRHPDTKWDSGLATRVPAADGWLVIYRSPKQGPLNALQVATLEVKVGDSVAIDKHPYYFFGASPLRIYVMSIDRTSRTVDIRVEKQNTKATQYFPTEGILDFLQWPIRIEAYVHPDEPVDQIAAGIARLRELRRLERLGGPRAADSMRVAVKEQVRQLQQMIGRFQT